MRGYEQEEMLASLKKTVGNRIGGEVADAAKSMQTIDQNAVCKH